MVWRRGGWCGAGEGKKRANSGAEAALSPEARGRVMGTKVFRGWGVWDGGVWGRL